MNDQSPTNIVKNTPLHNTNITLLGLVRRTNSQRNYVSSHQIVQLAIDKYKRKNVCHYYPRLQIKKNFNLILILMFTKLKV
jgi:hypothetical protein